MSDSEDEGVEKQLKIVFLGESNVGKTSIIRRICYNDFIRQYSATIGADFYIKRLIIPGKRDVTIKITDVGGTELRGTMLDNYLYNSDIILLVYDITNKTSFELIATWIDTISNLITSPPITAIIGNKCDLEHQRTVRLDKTKQFVKDYGLYSYLISAKTGESVTSSLMEIVAKQLGIKLTKIQREHQQSVLKVELINSPSDQAFKPRVRKPVHNHNSSVCSIQ